MSIIKRKSKILNPKAEGEDAIKKDLETNKSTAINSFSQEINTPNKKKKIALKLILSFVSFLVIFSLVLSCSAYLSAKSRYESISKSISKIEILQKDVEADNWLSNIMYESLFKEKTEREIVNLLKNNFYFSSSSNLVNLDSISKIEKIREVCNDFGLDETKYADVYLYIDTALDLEEYAKYDKLSKHLENTVPLLTSINTSSYYTIEMVAATLQQCIDSLTIVLGMIQGDMRDSQVYRYYEIVRELGECVVDAVKAGQKNDIYTMQQKIREYAFTLLDVYELVDEVEKAQKEVIDGVMKLIEIEKRIKTQ